MMKSNWSTVYTVSVKDESLTFGEILYGPAYQEGTWGHNLPSTEW